MCCGYYSGSVCQKTAANEFFLHSDDSIGQLQVCFVLKNDKGCGWPAMWIGLDSSDDTGIGTGKKNATFFKKKTISIHIFKIKKLYTVN